jgi:hypothetical protein
MSRHVGIRMLPDGSGRVRIHWFVKDEVRRSIQTPSRTALTERGSIVLGGATGYIACDPARKDVYPRAVRGIVELFCHSDDPRAATCPECCATEEFREVMLQYEPPAPQAPPETAEQAQQPRKVSGGKTAR